MKQLRLGIIGLGRAGFGMHTKELAGKEDMFKIEAVCDVEQDRCEKMKELYDTLLPYLSEKNQNIAYLREAKDFKLNYSNYKDYEKDGKEAYRDQYIEKDSRDYADKRMDEHYRYVLADIFD